MTLLFYIHRESLINTISGVIISYSIPAVNESLWPGGHIGQVFEIDQIIVYQQIRQSIDTACDSFLSLMESIRERGVLEPLLVVAGPDPGTYLLIAGERRLRACQMLGMTTVPVRILDQATTTGDIVTLQIIENLNREDLDPIDEAAAYLEFFRAMTGPTDVEVIIGVPWASKARHRPAGPEYPPEPHGANHPV